MNDRIELLMTRRLDGELSASESLELDKYLIREPAAREAFAELGMADGLAGALIRDWCTVPAAATAGHSRTPWWGRRWARCAAVACLALWSVWPTLFPEGSTPIVAAPAADGAVAPNVMVGQPSSSYQSRDTRVDWVYDPERQAFFLIETQRRASGRPGPGSAASPRGRGRVM